MQMRRLLVGSSPDDYTWRPACGAGRRRRGSPLDRCILPNRPGGLPVERSREEEEFEGDGVKGVLGGAVLAVNVTASGTEVLLTRCLKPSQPSHQGTEQNSEVFRRNKKAELFGFTLNPLADSHHFQH